MIWLTLEFINLVVLFRGVLGYPFRRQKAWFVAGAGVFVLKYLLEMVIIPNGGAILACAQVFVPAVGMVMAFEGKKKTLFVISACVMSTYSMLESLFLGIFIIAYKGNIMDIDYKYVMLSTQLFCMLVIVSFSCVLKRKNKSLFIYVQDLNPLVLIPFLISYPIYLYNPWIIGERIGFSQEFIHGKNLIRDGILVIFLVFAFVMICVYISQRKEMQRMLLLNQKCIAEQTAQYRLINQSNQEIRKFSHDYNEHILALQAIAETGDNEKIRRYIKELADVGESFKLIRTNHVVSDAILNQYAVMCKKAGFTLTVKGSFPDKIAIEETDFCVIFSNGIKNAYEAAIQCKSSQRKLEVEIVNRGNFVYVMIWNTVKEPPIIIDGIFETTKKDKLLHGIGIRNMIETAQRVGGNVHWDYEDGIVTTEIVLREET